MNRTIDAGPGLLALGGLLLIISLFLPWFDSSSAFTSFETLDIVLLLLGGGAIATGLGRTGDDPRVGLTLALVALLCVVVSVVDPPPVAGDDSSLDGGAWLALASAIAMLAGAAMTVASFSVSVDVRGRERRRRVAAVDRRAEYAEPEPEPELEREPEPVRPPESDPSSFAARRRSLMDDDDDQRTQAMPTVDPDQDH